MLRAENELCKKSDRLSHRFEIHKGLTKMTLTAGIVLPPDVIVLPARDGSMRLLDLRGNFFALDAAHGRVLRALIEGGIEHAAAVIAHEQSLDLAIAREDAIVFAAELKRAQLLQTGTGSGAGCARRGALFLRTMATALTGPMTEPARFGRRLLPLVKLVLAWTSWEDAVEVCASIVRRRSSAKLTGRTTLSELDHLVRRLTARHPLRAECKERALLFWTMAHQLGFTIDLVVGVRLYPFEGHCWCEHTGDFLSDEADRCRLFQPVRRYRFGLHGSLERETICD
jgi:hypothetical protein